MNTFLQVFAAMFIANVLWDILKLIWHRVFGDSPSNGGEVSIKISVDSSDAILKIKEIQNALDEIELTQKRTGI